MLRVDTQLGRSRDEIRDLNGGLLDDPLDERLGGRRLPDVVVVVDREPRIRRPRGEILGEKIDEHTDFGGRVARRVEALRQTAVAALDDVRTGCRHLPRENRDVRR